MMMIWSYLLMIIFSTFDPSRKEAANTWTAMSDRKRGSDFNRDSRKRNKKFKTIVSTFYSVLCFGVKMLMLFMCTETWLFSIPLVCRWRGRNSIWTDVFIWFSRSRASRYFISCCELDVLSPETNRKRRSRAAAWKAPRERNLTNPGPKCTRALWLWHSTLPDVGHVTFSSSKKIASWRLVSSRSCFVRSRYLSVWERLLQHRKNNSNENN